jgi:dihydropyrimidine dehydrogenase (NAD+) subunit PreA
VIANIHADKCIGCELCYTACWDGAHQCIHMDRAPQPDPGRITVTPIPKLDGPTPDRYKTPLHRIPRVDEHECVGCNLCALVCPVDGCITMDRVENGLSFQSWEQRTQ